MRITGTIINYYFHCKRQCYLFANRINLEDNSEDVRIGKVLHEIRARDKDEAEIKYENVVLDKITAKYIEEYKKKDRPKVVLTWAPHPKALPQAVPNSFADFMNEADVDFVITHPEGYELDPKFVRGAKVEYDQMKAFEGADFIYAKNWACPGVTNPADYGKVLSKDMGWTVDAKHMAVTNNAYFMHCLPVRRNMIVTDDVIEAPTSLVIPEAANREISATVVLKRMLQSL